jgi:predicted RNA polymerase sigma factor
LEEGFHFLERSARGGDMSRFHVEAGIAAAHAAAETYAATDWGHIVSLYDTLRTIAPKKDLSIGTLKSIERQARIRLR